MPLPPVYFIYSHWLLTQGGCLHVQILFHIHSGPPCAQLPYRESFLDRKPMSFRGEDVCVLNLESKSCGWVCSFSNQFFLHKNKPIKLNMTFCYDYDFLIRISLNFGQSYIFYYLLSKHTFFSQRYDMKRKRCVLLFVSFWGMQKCLTPARIRRKKLLMKRLQYYFAMYALTLVELLVVWNTKGIHSTPVGTVQKGVWSESCICTLQQQWRWGKKKIPAIIRLLLRGIGNSWFDQDF